MAGSGARRGSDVVPGFFSIVLNGRERSSTPAGVFDVRPRFFESDSWLTGACVPRLHRASLRWLVRRFERTPRTGRRAREVPILAKVIWQVHLSRRQVGSWQLVSQHKEAFL